MAREARPIAGIAESARHRRDRKTKTYHGGTETRRHGEQPSRKIGTPADVSQLRNRREQLVRTQAGGMIIDGGSDHQFIGAGLLDELFQSAADGLR